MKLIQNKNLFQKSDYFVLLPKEQKIMPINFISDVKYLDLINIDEQKLKLSKNLESYSLNNDSEHTLRCGSRGCGKSTLVKLSIKQLNSQIKKKIKLIEVFNLSLDLIADLSFILSQYNYMFIIFVDDVNLNVSDEVKVLLAVPLPLVSTSTVLNVFVSVFVSLHGTLTTA